MMNEIGLLCVKLAGRDSNRKCVIVDIIDENHVLVDGETRRKKCNTKHLEPLNQKLKIKKGASHEEIKKAFSTLGIELTDKKSKKTAEKPKKQKAKKSSPEEKKTSKKVAKKPAKEKVAKESSNQEEKDKPQEKKN